MTGLVIRLKPNEKILVNGVVLQNCDRAARFRIKSNDVSILRSRDAIPQKSANTPLRRLYYVAQLALAGEADPEKAKAQIQSGIDPLKAIFAGTAQLDLERAYEAAEKHKFFIVMRALKKLFGLEQSLLAAQTRCAL